MKVKASIKKRGPNDQIVRRKGKLYVINKRNPRHKQSQGYVWLEFQVLIYQEKKEL